MCASVIPSHPCKNDSKATLNMHGFGCSAAKYYSVSATARLGTNVQDRLGMENMPSQEMAKSDLSLPSVDNVTLNLSQDTVCATSSVAPDLLSAAEPAFSSIGLAHAWPSGWLQAIMELMHVDLGYTWCGTIFLTTLLLRLLTFPLIVRAQRNMVTMNHHLPEIQKYQYEAIKATTKQEAVEANANLKQLFHEKCINPGAQFVPIIGQAIVFTSMFFALRGMTACPVESMRTGGMGWFTDLIACDPIYLLPVLTAGTLALNLKLGADTVDPKIEPAMKHVVRIFPIMTLFITMQFPAALNLYWLSTNIVSVFQGLALKRPKIRSMLNLGDIKYWDKKDLPMTDVNMFEVYNEISAQKVSETVKAEDVIEELRSHQKLFDEMDVQKASQTAKTEDVIEELRPHQKGYDEMASQRASQTVKTEDVIEELKSQQKKPM